MCLSSWQFFQPVVGRLDLACSLDNFTLRLSRQVNKVVGAPAAFAVFAEGSLEGVIGGALIIRGHDVFLLLGKA